LCLQERLFYLVGFKSVKTIDVVEPKKRIETIDVLRGFALLGIIFNNILYFSGYAFLPFDRLRQLPNSQLNDVIYYLIDLFVTAKFYTLFSMLFAVGFYLQFSKYRNDPVDFLNTYRRRILILSFVGLIHSLIWFGDILLTYTIIISALIFFRDVKVKNLLRWSLFFFLLPFVIDAALIPFSHLIVSMSPKYASTFSYVNYPDMTPDAVTDIFQHGTFLDVFRLNLHNIVWKYVGTISSGRFLKLLAIFLLGYYLASIHFFTKNEKSNLLLISSFIIGFTTTISAQMMGGSQYQFPPTWSNIIFKLLFLIGQISICLFYIVSIRKVSQISAGEKLLQYLKPVGRMALTNYLSQTIICIVIFYNVGFDLFGRVSLVSSVGVAILILIFQIIASNFWLKYFRFGPLEWGWRCLTYKQLIKLRC